MNFEDTDFSHRDAEGAEEKQNHNHRWTRMNADLNNKVPKQRSVFACRFDATWKNPEDLGSFVPWLLKPGIVNRRRGGNGSSNGQFPVFTFCSSPGHLISASAWTGAREAFPWISRWKIPKVTRVSRLR